MHECAETFVIYIFKNLSKKISQPSTASLQKSYFQLSQKNGTNCRLNYGNLTTLFQLLRKKSERILH